MWSQGESEGSLSSEGVPYGRPDYRDQMIIIEKEWFQRSWSIVIIWEWLSGSRLSWLCPTRRRDGSKEDERRNQGGMGWSSGSTPKYSSSGVTVFFNTYLSHQVIWPGDVVDAERFCQKGGDEVTFLVNLVVFDLRQTRFWKGFKRFGAYEIVDILYLWHLMWNTLVSTVVFWWWYCWCLTTSRTSCSLTSLQFDGLQNEHLVWETVTKENLQITITIFGTTGRNMW